MKAPVSPQLKVGIAGQTQTYDTALPYLHVDNPTNARIRFDNGMTVGPYTLAAVISLPSTTGSYQVDTSDISYPNVGIFPGAQISTWLTDEEHPQPGVSYAPTTIINSGTINATITGNVGITGTVNTNISSQSANVNVQFPSPQQVTINSGTVNATISGTPNINIQSQSVNLNTQQPQTSLGSFTVPSNGSNNSGNLNVPTGTHAIGILVDSGGLSQLIVTGVTSGIKYINLSDQPPPNEISVTGYFVSPVLSVVDTQVVVTGSCRATQGPTVVRSVAILDAEGVFIFDNSREPAATFATDSSGTYTGTVDGSGQPLATLPIVSTIPFLKTGGQQGQWASTSISPPAAATTAFQILAANIARRGCLINAFINTGQISILLASGQPRIVTLPVTGYWEMPSPINSGIVEGFTEIASVGGAVIATEIT